MNDLFRICLLLSVSYLSVNGFSQKQDTIFPFEKKYNGIEIIAYRVPLLNKDEGSYNPPFECEYNDRYLNRNEDDISEKPRKCRIGIVNKKYGVFSVKGEEIIAPEYDSLYQVGKLNPAVFIVRKNGKYGLVEENNKIIYPPVYDKLESVGRSSGCSHVRSLFLAQKGNKQGLLRLNGTSKVKVKYDYVNHFYTQTQCPTFRKIVCVKKDEKYGFVNDNDSAVIPFIYSDIKTTHPHPYYKDKIIAQYNGKYGVIDYQNTILIPFNYEDINFHYLDGYDMVLAVKEKVKWGLVSSGNRLIVKPKFDSIEYLIDAGEGKFAYSDNGYWGIADTNGNILIKAEFSEIQALPGDFYSYSQNGKYGFVSRYGRVLSNAIYKDIRYVSDHLALLSNDKYHGIFNMISGKEIVPPVYIIPWEYYGEYDLFWDKYLYSKQMFWKNKDDQYGVIDSSGNTLIPFEYDQPFEINSWKNRIIGEKNGKKYLFDLDGNLIAGGFDNVKADDYETADFYITQNNGSYGLISPSGEMLLENRYNSIRIKHDRSRNNPGPVFFEVENNGKRGIIKGNGEFIIPCEYEYISYANEAFSVVKGLKTALLNLEGETMEPLDFKVSEELSSKYREIKYGNKFAVIDQNGKRVDKGEYDYYNKIQNTYIIVTKQINAGAMENYRSSYKYKYGLLDTNLNIIFPAVYRDIHFYRDDFGKLCDNNFRYYFFDFINGVHEEKYVEIRQLPSGHFEVEESEYIEGICDSTGKIIIEPQFEKIKYYDGSFAAVKKNGLYGFCDGEGKMLTEYKYEAAKGIYKNFLSVGLNSKYGVVDKSGEVIVPFKYTSKVNFNHLKRGHHFIKIESTEGYGLLDSNMKEVIPPICVEPIKDFSKAGDFKYVIVSTNDGKSGVFLSNGEEFLPIKEHQVNDLFLATTGLFSYAVNGEYGLINTEEKVILKPKYDTIIGNIKGYSVNFDWNSPQPYLLFQEDKKYGVLSVDGKKIAKAVFDDFEISKIGEIILFKGSKSFLLEKNGQIRKLK
ncbi:MAG: WG repeat-containing protein [Crocinitomicaceae bacterium]